MELKCFVNRHDVPVLVFLSCEGKPLELVDLRPGECIHYKEGDKITYRTWQTAPATTQKEVAK